MVAVLDECGGPDRRLGRDMEDDCSYEGQLVPREMRTGSVTPCFRASPESEVAPLGMPARRPPAFQHHDARRVALERGVVHAAREVVDVLEHDRASLVLVELRLCGTDLHHRSVRAEVPPEDDERSALVEGFLPRPNDLRIDDLSALDVLCDRSSRHRDCAGREVVVAPRRPGTPPA